MTECSDTREDRCTAMNDAVGNIGDGSKKKDLFLIKEMQEKTVSVTNDAVPQLKKYVENKQRKNKKRDRSQT